MQDAIEISPVTGPLRATIRPPGSKSITNRALLYGTINSGGLLINWFILISLERMGLNYLIANLVGAAMAAVWNFSLNNALTWRE